MKSWTTRKVIVIANKNEYRVNEEIGSHESCRLIGEDGEQLGVFSVAVAQERADELGLDLVEISPNADPPVCRIMDYGKFKYEKQKKEKENKKNSKQAALKEMKFRCNIGDGDYNTKKKHIVRFLESGSKVKITIMFKGRQMDHPELGLSILDKLTSDLEDIANVVSKPVVEGRNMTMVIEPVKK